MITVQQIARVRTFAEGQNLDAMALAALLPVLALMQPTPRAVGVAEVVYGVLAAAVVIRSALRNRQGIGELPPRWLWLPHAALVAILLLSFAWSVPSGTSVAAWLRGLAPFTGVLLLIPAYELARLREGRQILIGGLLTGALLVYGQVLVTATIVVPRVIEAGTAAVIRNYLPPQAYSVLGLAGFAFLAGYVAVPGRWRREAAFAVAFALVCLFLTFLRIYAVLAVLLLLATCWLLLRGRLRREWFTPRRVGILAAIVGVSVLAIAVVPAVGGLFDAVAGAYADRFGSLVAAGLDNTRVAELRAVIGEWSERPLIGRGPGHEYTYVRPETGLVWRGAYTHNLLSYLLLVAGPVGAAIGAWILAAVVRAVRFGWPMSAIGMGARFAILAVVVYALVQATFRTVGYWPIFVILVAVMMAEAWGPDAERPSP